MYMDEPRVQEGRVTGDGGLRKPTRCGKRKNSDLT